MYIQAAIDNYTLAISVQQTLLLLELLCTGGLFISDQERTASRYLLQYCAL